ncbi:MAG TPA: ATPase [Clostridiales bacterium]|nr:ATPase [Clostridiales bacterium]
MNKDISKNQIIEGQTALGIEFGSTRIKAVLIDKEHNILATGYFLWENKLDNGIWTYSLNDAIIGLQKCYQEIKDTIFRKYGIKLKVIGSIGISAMMHGYLVLDKDDNLLVPFRTWRNNIAKVAADELTSLFNYKIAARWSIAHLYHAIKNKEQHVKNIAYQTALEGYIHYLLTGEKVIGIGEASGMFRIDLNTKNYNQDMVCQFESLEAVKTSGLKINKIFPKALVAGEEAGKLTQKGAKIIDPSGDLQPGIPFCPPEGDAGTGMVSTNSVKPRTGNISAGTSIFGMIILEKELSKTYSEIDLVTTPSGELSAMAHCNNCSSEINAWMDLFGEIAQIKDKELLYQKMFSKSLEGETDCGGVLAYNYVSSENITGIKKGRPLLVRTPESNFTLANFMRSQLYAAFATLKIGLDLLIDNEQVKIDKIYAHGGLFKTEQVAQRYLSAAINTPVTVMKTANEGGAWGMAILAMYLLRKKDNQSLENYLENEVFGKVESVTLEPDLDDVRGFNQYIKRFKSGLPIVKKAVELL